MSQYFRSPCSNSLGVKYDVLKIFEQNDVLLNLFEQPTSVFCEMLCVMFTMYILYADGKLLVDNKISFEIRSTLTKYGHRQCLLPCLQCCQTGQQI